MIAGLLKTFVLGGFVSAEFVFEIEINSVVMLRLNS